MNEPPLSAPAGRPLRRSLNALRLVLGVPHRLLAWVSIVIFSYLILWPVLEIVVNSFRVHERDVRRIGAALGEWTMFYWERIFASVFSESIFWGPLKNTVLVATGYTVMSIAIGVTLARMIVRTDIPANTLIYTLYIIPFYTTTIFLSPAFIL